MNIPLHPGEGIRPALLKCPRCGNDSGEIGLIGNALIYECRVCGAGTAAYRRPRQCPNGHRAMESRPITEAELHMLPGSLCDACKKEQKLFDEEIAKGGVFFRCACGAQGIVRAGVMLAVEVRRHLGIAAPAACGVKLEHCPQCLGGGGEADSSDHAGDPGSTG